MSIKRGKQMGVDTKPTSPAKPKSPRSTKVMTVRIPADIIKGLVLQATGLMVVWFLLGFVSSERQRCVVGDTGCILTQALILFLAVILMALNYLAVRAFRNTSDKQTVSTERMVGIGYGFFSILAGFSAMAFALRNILIHIR